MLCNSCKDHEAGELCPRCNNWICDECVREHEGELVCQQCYDLMYDSEVADLELSDVGDQQEDS